MRLVSVGGDRLERDVGDPVDRARLHRRREAGHPRHHIPGDQHDRSRGSGGDPGDPAVERHVHTTPRTLSRLTSTVKPLSSRCHLHCPCGAVALRYCGRFKEEPVRVLIVEDEGLIARFVARALQAEGYTTSVAPDGEVACRRLRDEEWDLAILDLLLPAKSGFDVLRELSQATNQVPVLVLSARRSVEDEGGGAGRGRDRLPGQAVRAGRAAGAGAGAASPRPLAGRDGARLRARPGVHAGRAARARCAGATAARCRCRSASSACSSTWSGRPTRPSRGSAS